MVLTINEKRIQELEAKVEKLEEQNKCGNCIQQVTYCINADLGKDCVYTPE